MPQFDVAGGLLLAVVRAVWVAALLSSFGGLMFWVVVLPRALARAPEAVASRVHGILRLCCWGSLGAAGAALLAWMLAETAYIAGSAGVRQLAAVAGSTVFGHLAMLQFAGLAATGLVLGPGRARGRRIGAAGLAGITLAVQAGHGHGFAMADGLSLLVAAAVLHLLAAGAWLGGLMPLLLVIRVSPARTGAAAARWFSPLGLWCVAGVAASAAIQFWGLIGGVPGLLGTAYGWMASAKIVGFAVLLGFAWVNRFRLAPRLLGPAGEPSRPALIRAVAVQTGVGLLVVLAASVMSSLPPAVEDHPVWPFTLARGGPIL